MDADLKRRLSQLGQMSASGMFGSTVKVAADEFDKLPLGMPVFLKLVRDFYEPRPTEEDREMARIADMFCQLIIVVYREARRQDESVALAFANSFIKDFPGADGSCVFSQWDSLARASLAFKETTTSHLLAWQHAAKLVQAYNEFLNVLLGFFIIGWRCAKQKKLSIGVFNNAYGSKLKEFEQLTGGEDSAFYLIFRLARPNLRNAIAHENIWLDTESNKVVYTDGKDKKCTHQIDLIEFMGLAALGSHIGRAYLAALASIIVLEDGSDCEVAQLPPHLVQVFRHRA